MAILHVADHRQRLPPPIRAKKDDDCEVPLCGVVLHRDRDPRVRYRDPAVGRSEKGLPKRRPVRLGVEAKSVSDIVFDIKMSLIKNSN